MADETLIAWTDRTLNFWMGCTRVSEGCRHCYAETLTKNRMGLQLWGPQAPRQVTKSPWQHARQWEKAAARGDTPGNYGDAVWGAKTPTAAKEGCDGVTFTPHLVFVGSLMDWAEDRRDLDDVRVRMWEVIRTSPHLWFQMLTKRPENILKFLPSDWGADGYPNVWIGSTVEDNRVKARADHLRAVPARARFISYEPAVGPGNEIDLTGIDWVIAGGESGPGYRPADMQWFLDMRNRCVGGHREPGPQGSWPDYSVESGREPGENRLAFFMKQQAAYRTEINPFLVERDGSQWAYKQYPGNITEPVRMAA